MRPFYRGQRREAWDDPVYWQLGYPLLLLAAFILSLVWRVPADAFRNLSVLNSRSAPRASTKSIVSTPVL